MGLISKIYRYRQPKQSKKKHKLPNIPLSTPKENIELLAMYEDLLGCLPYQNILKETNYLTITDEEWQQFFSMICEIDMIRRNQNGNNYKREG
jgi:hypothetical protein